MKEREAARATRMSARKAKKPSLPKQANLIRWVLTTQVPLDHIQIPEEMIREACNRYRYDYEEWLRVERRYGLMRKIYDRRAQIRGNPGFHLDA
jgi:hypothetical protein